VIPKCASSRPAISNCLTHIQARLGIGGITPKSIEDGSFTKRAPTSNDKLLETLIGKKKAKAHIAAKQLPARPGAQQQQQRYGKPTPVKEDSEDEEEGRATTFKSKKRRPNLKPAFSVEDSDEEHESRGPETVEPTGDARVEEANDENEAQPVKRVADEKKDLTPPPKSIPSRSKAKPKSYLDEILAERSSKKRKKSKNKGQADV
jgi:hypothetical protein